MANDYSLLADENKRLKKDSEDIAMFNMELIEKNKDLWEENSFLKHLRRENEECIEQQRKKIKLLETHIIVLEWMIDKKTRD